MRFPGFAAISVVGAAVLACLVSGCDQVQQVQQGVQKGAEQKALMEDLKSVGRAFVNYSDAHGGAAPQSWEHLAEGGLSPEARQTLESAGYRLILGVSFRDATVGTSNFIIAHPANPTGETVLVGMMDGSVQNLWRAEYDQKLADQQAIMSGAVILDPPPADASAPTSSSSGAPSPYVPPPPPSSN